MTGPLDAAARPTPGQGAQDHPPAVRRGTTRGRWFWWGVLVVTLAGAGVVLLGALWGHEVDTAPTDRATVWISDMAEGRSEQALQQTRAEGIERHPTGESLQEEFEGFLGGRVGSLRPGEQVISRGPEGAAVHVPFTGVMADGSPTRFDVTVVRHEGRWLVCGFR